MNKLHIICLCIIITLTGCSTSQEEILPTNPNQTILDLWGKSSGAQSLLDTRKSLRRDIGSETLAEQQHTYTRTAENEAQQLFPRLPNPDLVMYIYPHITHSTPVPGYSTVFSFYVETHYALPGENTKGL